MFCWWESGISVVGNIWAFAQFFYDFFDVLSSLKASASFSYMILDSEYGIQ